MRRILFTGLLCCSAWLSAEPLTLSRIVSEPSLAGSQPSKPALSPDGQRVTWLAPREDDLERYDLWQYQLSSGQRTRLVDSTLFEEGELSEEEKARRERQRIYGKGLLEYQWDTQGKALLFPIGGDIWLYRLASGKPQQLTRTEAFETDARFSPKGNYVSFIRQQNLVVIDLRTGQEQLLTLDGKGALKNGMSEFVAQEEMDRMSGYWWSPDETAIAFLQVDESPVEQVIRNEIFADGIKLTEQRYPYAGKDNASVRIGVVSLDGGAIQWLPGARDNGGYLPRVNWNADGSAVTWQWQSRDQQTLQLWQWRKADQRRSLLLTETSRSWINLSDDLHFLHSQPGFIWSSERSGFRHLYLMDDQGNLVRQLTEGDWAVDAVEAIDEAGGWVYFSGRRDTPLQRHLYRVSLKGGEVQRLSQRAGFHQPVFSDDGSVYLDHFSSTRQPPQLSLHQADGKTISWIAENAIEGDHPLVRYWSDWTQPEYGTLKADNGMTLYYRLFKPKTRPGQRYPVVVRVYGGPHAQTVRDSWSRHDYFTQYLVQQGFAVFQLDNRGSAARGLAFESEIYRRLGQVEVADQVVGAQYLKSLSWVDPDRIGIYGHSYGGYMTLMSLFTAPDSFAAGVSGAPVTDWSLYDTHYTERYLAHPASNAEGYRLSSVFPYVDQLKGQLFVYHGMADDNVLYQNSTKLYKSLQDAGKLYESKDYPGSKHSMRGKSVQLHLMATIEDFLKRRL
ncbi:S9 family peptidase [Ferrimonas kyonanensis]|uniref:S9 family peptidase n=1 Tax=Ferrimonas kyonanensis TaxID=364763 RepID=UPI0003FAFD5E|nr:S9 family peptidase [Ferrimonas kyonanensis]